MLSREYSKGDTGSVDCSSYDMKTREMYRAQTDTDFGFGVSKLRLGLAAKKPHKWTVSHRTRWLDHFLCMKILGMTTLNS